MPRYMGFVWPAVCLAAAALLLRLPTKALRGFAILLFLSVNLTNAFGRIYADSEPPVDQMSADVIAGQKPGTLTFCNIRGGGAHPGEGTLSGGQGRYYLAATAGLRPRWWEFRSASFHQAPDMVVEDQEWRKGPKATFRPTIDPLKETAFHVLPDSLPAIKAEVSLAEQNNEDLHHVIVWHRYAGTDLPPLEDESKDEILQTLGPNWRRAMTHDYTIRQHWSWRELTTCRRLEYVK